MSQSMTQFAKRLHFYMENIMMINVRIISQNVIYIMVTNTESATTKKKPLCLHIVNFTGKMNNTELDILLLPHSSFTQTHKIINKK